ncbi:MAG: hypothetical protein AAGK21_13125 [Bacteroidota bacterium]
MTRSAVLLGVAGVAGTLAAALWDGWFLDGDDFADVLSTAAPLALGVGAFGGGLVWAFYRWQRQSLSERREALEAEGLLLDGPANVEWGAHRLGGWLWLTDEALELTPLGAPWAQGRDWRIDRDEITSVEPTRTRGLVPNAFRVRSATEPVVVCTVHGRARWITELTGRTT